MSIQIIITGNHATDAISELKMFSDAIFGNKDAIAPFVASTGAVFAEVQLPAVNNENVAEGCQQFTQEEIELNKGVTLPAEKPKRASRRKVEPATVASVLAAGDDIGIESELVAVPAEKVVVAAPAEDEPELVVTLELLKKLVMQKTKGADGVDDPKQYAKCFKVISDSIPKGKTTMMSNIPEDKLAEVYYEVAAI